MRTTECSGAIFAGEDADRIAAHQPMTSYLTLESAAFVEGLGRPRPGSPCQQHSHSQVFRRLTPPCTIRSSQLKFVFVADDGVQPLQCSSPKTMPRRSL